MDLDRRIAQFECENRRIKAALPATLIGVAVIAAMRAKDAEPPMQITGTGLSIVDSKGNVCLRLSAGDANLPFITVHDVKSGVLLTLVQGLIQRYEYGIWEKVASTSLLLDTPAGPC